MGPPALRIARFVATPLSGRRGIRNIRIVGVDAWSRTFRARIVRTLSDRFAAGTVLEGRFAIDGAFVHTGIVLPGD